jgi:mRNA-degrading endonuclease RelE of RelBE toxin-antitoxin system
VKALKDAGGVRRVRVGPLRILFEQTGRAILVARIVRRDQAYR